MLTIEVPYNVMVLVLVLCFLLPLLAVFCTLVYLAFQQCRRQVIYWFNHNFPNETGKINMFNFVCCSYLWFVNISKLWFLLNSSKRKRSHHPPKNPRRIWQYRRISFLFCSCTSRSSTVSVPLPWSTSRRSWMSGILWRGSTASLEARKGLIRTWENRRWFLFSLQCIFNLLARSVCIYCILYLELRITFASKVISFLFLSSRRYVALRNWFSLSHLLNRFRIF